tara:strand:- start:1705 stop:2367 length:663 start_codon:yes stop_codon:yes gene_type:complete
MKIALISLPRVGSNSIFNMMQAHWKDYEVFNEPYTPFRNQFDIDVSQLDGNVLYKGLVHHCPIIWNDRYSMFPDCDNTGPVYVEYKNGNLKWCDSKWYGADDDVISFIDDMENNYDKIIYIDGEDMDRIVHSYQVALITKEWYKKTDYSIEYSNDEFYVSKEEDKKHWEKYFNHYQKIIKCYSKDYNYFTYEGLFKNKTERNKLNEYLDTDIFKYEQERE